MRKAAQFFGKIFLHQKLRSDAKVEEYSTLAITSLFVNFVLVVFYFTYKQAGAISVADRIFEAWVMVCLALVSLKYLGSLRICVNLMMLAGFDSVIVASYWLGGIQAPGLIWIPAAIMITGYYFKLSEALFWICLYSGASAYMYSLGLHGQIPPSQLAIPVMDEFRVRAVLGACALASILSWTYRRTRDSIEKKNQEAYQELNQLRIELEKQLEENKTIVRVLSHDFTNMITVADGWATQIQQSGPAKTKIKNSMDMMLKMISSMRNYRAALDGKVELVKTSVCVFDAFEKTQKILEERIEQKQIQFQFIGDKSLSVYFDEQILVAQIFANIVSNAIKFAPNGSQIQMSCSCTSGFVRITIKDEGIGMPSEILQNLFLFGKKTTRTGLNGERGTGYGMPIVKTFVENFGGKISVMSKEESSYPQGHGTEFILELPMAQTGLHQVV